MKIKNDHNFTLYYYPKEVKVIDLDFGKKYIETYSGDSYENFYHVYELIYDEEGQRLDSPYIKSYNLVELKDE